MPEKQIDNFLKYFLIALGVFAVTYILMSILFPLDNCDTKTKETFENDAKRIIRKLDKINKNIIDLSTIYINKKIQFEEDIVKYTILSNNLLLSLQNDPRITDVTETPFQGSASIINEKPSPSQGSASYITTPYQGSASIINEKPSPSQGSASVTETPYQGSASYITTPYQGSASITETPYQGSASVTGTPSQGSASVTESFNYQKYKKRKEKREKIVEKFTNNDDFNNAFNALTAIYKSLASTQQELNEERDYINSLLKESGDSSIILEKDYINSITYQTLEKTIKDGSVILQELSELPNTDSDLVKSLDASIENSKKFISDINGFLKESLIESDISLNRLGDIYNAINKLINGYNLLKNEIDMNKEQINACQLIMKAFESEKNKPTPSPSLLNTDNNTTYIQQLAYVLNNPPDNTVTPSLPQYYYFGIMSSQYCGSQLNNNIVVIIVNGIFPDPSDITNYILSGDNTGGFFPSLKVNSTGLANCPSIITNNVTYTMSTGPNGSCYANTVQQTGTSPVCLFPGENGLCMSCEDPTNASCLIQTEPVCLRGEVLCSDGLCYTPCPSGYTQSTQQCNVCNPDIGDSNNVILTLGQRTQCDTNSANVFNQGQCFSYAVLDSSTSASSSTQFPQKCNTSVYEQDGLLYDSNYVIPKQGFSNIFYFSENDGTLPYMSCGQTVIGIQPFNLILNASANPNEYTLNIVIQNIDIKIPGFNLKLKPLWNNVKFDVHLFGNNISVSDIMVTSQPPTTPPPPNCISIGNGLYIVLPENSQPPINMQFLQYILCIMINNVISILQNLQGLSLPFIGILINNFASYVINDSLFNINVTSDPLSYYLYQILINKLNISIENIYEDIPVFGWDPNGPLALVFNNISNMTIQNQLSYIQSLIPSNSVYNRFADVLTNLGQSNQLYENLGIDMDDTVYTPVDLSTNLSTKISTLQSSILNSIDAKQYDIFKNIVAIYLPAIISTMGINTKMTVPSVANAPTTWNPPTGTTSTTPTTTATTTTTTPTVTSNVLTADTEIVFKPQIQGFTVQGFNTVIFYAWGAGGGGANSNIGGNGAFIAGYFSVLPSDNIYISVGQGGFSGTTGPTEIPYGGGGIGWNGSGSGGGCTVISLNNRIIAVIGGGGGGASNNLFTSYGGWATSLQDNLRGNGEPNTSGGAGANSILGLQYNITNGIPDGEQINDNTHKTYVDSNGVVSQGGQGGYSSGSASSFLNGGGGGGGGYIGGGGGASSLSGFGAGGGGGGSSFIDTSVVTIISQSVGGAYINIPNVNLNTQNPGIGSNIGGNGCVYLQLQN